MGVMIGLSMLWRFIVALEGNKESVSESQSWYTHTSSEAQSIAGRELGAAGVASWIRKRNEGTGMGMANTIRSLSGYARCIGQGIHG